MLGRTVEFHGSFKTRLVRLQLQNHVAEDPSAGGKRLAVHRVERFRMAALCGMTGRL